MKADDVTATLALALVSTGRGISPVWGGRDQSERLVKTHVAGERLFVDYAGTTIAVIDGSTGEAMPAQLFVAALGASNYTYAEATWTQCLADWIGSHTRAFAFIGGVTAMVVSDNLKSGIAKACFYEPAVNRTYAEMAAHYDTAIVPARPYKPRDKAKVEVAVQVATRFIIAKLRNRRFFSLAELNAAIAELVAQLNERVSRHLGASRRALFEELERAALKPLPAEPYVFAEWKECRVGLDYHVEIEKHYYSAPHSCCARKSGHASPRAPSKCSTAASGLRHMCAVRKSQAHDGARAHAVEPPALCRLDAGAPQAAGRRDRALTAVLVDIILRDRTHPEQGFRSCVGIMRLARVTAPNGSRPPATGRWRSARTLRSVNSILKTNRDRHRLAPPTDEPAIMAC